MPASNSSSSSFIAIGGRNTVFLGGKLNAGPEKEANKSSMQSVEHHKCHAAVIMNALACDLPSCIVFLCYVTNNYVDIRHFSCLFLSSFLQFISADKNVE